MSNLRSVKLKLFIPAAGATTTPPFGPILAQYGVNTVQFCKDFNEVTEGLTFFFNDSIKNNWNGFVLSVNITINEDKSYSYTINKPSTSFLLRMLADVKTGSPQQKCGYFTLKETYLLATFKFPRLTANAACKMIAGTARSIGIKIY